jgi:hypothetical protein
MTSPSLPAVARGVAVGKGDAPGTGEVRRQRSANELPGLDVLQRDRPASTGRRQHRTVAAEGDPGDGPMPGASGSPIGRREWASRRITVPSGLELASSAPSGL